MQVVTWWFKWEKKSISKIIPLDSFSFLIWSVSTFVTDPKLKLENLSKISLKPSLFEAKVLGFLATLYVMHVLSRLLDAEAIWYSEGTSIIGTIRHGHKSWHFHATTMSLWNHFESCFLHQWIKFLYLPQRSIVGGSNYILNFHYSPDVQSK